MPKEIIYAIFLTINLYVTQLLSKILQENNIEMNFVDSNKKTFQNTKKYI